MDTSYNNVCLIYIVNFVEGACLSRVSACLISTWVAKSHRESLQRPENYLYSVEGFIT